MFLVGLVVVSTKPLKVVNFWQGISSDSPALTNETRTKYLPGVRSVDLRGGTRPNPFFLFQISSGRGAMRDSSFLRPLVDLMCFDLDLKMTCVWTKAEVHGVNFPPPQPF